MIKKEYYTIQIIKLDATGKILQDTVLTIAETLSEAINIVNMWSDKKQDYDTIKGNYTRHLINNKYLIVKSTAKYSKIFCKIYNLEYDKLNKRKKR